MGKSKASVIGANALHSFPNIEHIIMVGIAGGCPNPGDLSTHIRLGDIVVSAAEAGVLEYDFVKNTDVVEIRRSPQPTSVWLNSAMTNMITEAIAGERPWERWIDKLIADLGRAYERPDAIKDILYEDGVAVDHPADPDRQPGRPKIFQGLIGSADILQKNAGDRDRLRDEFKVRAIEMEASGLQTAAWAQGKQIYVVRGICDYCDKHKNDDWQNYAAASAAAVARVLIETLPVAWL